MPTYDYACPSCGGFDALRTLAARNEPAACPGCHEPKRSGEYPRMRHPAGCGCCAPGSRKSTTVTGANGAKAFPSKRPWMISH